MIAHVSLNGGAVTRVPETLDPGAGTGPIDLGPLAPGQHVVSIPAEGVVGGCNSGGVRLGTPGT